MEVKWSIFHDVKSDYTLHKIPEVIWKFANCLEIVNFLFFFSFFSPSPPVIYLSYPSVYLLLKALLLLILFMAKCIAFFSIHILHSPVLILSIPTHHCRCWLDMTSAWIYMTQQFLNDWLKFGRNSWLDYSLYIKESRWAMVIHAEFLTLGFSWSLQFWVRKASAKNEL